MRAAVKQFAAFVRREFDVEDLFVFGGLACAAYGIAQVYPPAAWIVTGAVLFGLGVKR